MLGKVILHKEKLNVQVTINAKKKIYIKIVQVRQRNNNS